MSSAPVVDESEAKAEGAPSSPPGAKHVPFRWTVDLFNRTVAAGVFGEGDPVILWEGELVRKFLKGRDHRDASVALANLLIRTTPPAFHARIEQPILIGDHSRPEPDFTIVRGTFRDFRGRVPKAESIALIVEVADRSLAVDSEIVLEAYASQSIPVYWIVNLPKRRVEVYSEPTGPIEDPGFRLCEQYRAGDSVPVVLDGAEVGRVAVDDILP